MALIWQTSTQISQIPTCASCFSFTASFTVDIFGASCASFWASWWPANTAVSSGPVRWRSTNFEDGAFSVKPNSNRLKEIQQICLHHHFLVIYPHSWLLPAKFKVLECELYRFLRLSVMCVCVASISLSNSFLSFATTSFQCHDSGKARTDEKDPRLQVLFALGMLIESLFRVCLHTFALKDADIVERVWRVNWRTKRRPAFSDLKLFRQGSQ